MENFNKIINFVLIIIINLFYIKKSPIYKFIKLLKIIIIYVILKKLNTWILKTITWIKMNKIKLFINNYQSISY